MERRRARDALLREVYRRHYFDMPPRTAAGMILDALDHQSRARGRVTDDLSRALAALLQSDPPVPSSARQIARMLDIQDPL